MHVGYCVTLDNEFKLHKLEPHNVSDIKRVMHDYVRLFQDFFGIELVGEKLHIVFNVHQS